MKITNVVEQALALSPLAQKLKILLETQPDDEVFRTPELAKLLKCNPESLQQHPYNTELFQDYKIRVRGQGAKVCYWGSKKAILKLQKSLEPIQKPTKKPSST